MTETKTVILVAWDNETEHSLSDADKQRLDDNNIEIVYTGIGKINATRKAITDLCVKRIRVCTTAASEEGLAYRECRLCRFTHHWCKNPNQA